MVLILHTCQVQDRFRDDCVLCVRNGTLCMKIMELSAPFSSFGKCLRSSVHMALFAAKLKVKGPLCPLLLCFKENPWAYTLSFVIIEAPRGNYPVLCRVWHLVLICYLPIWFNKASVMLKSVVSNGKDFRHAHRASVRQGKKAGSSSVLHIHKYFRGQNGVRICWGCGPQPSPSQLAIWNKTTITTAQKQQWPQGLTPCPGRGFLSRWNEWCREVLCSVSAQSEKRCTLGTGSPCPRRVITGVSLGLAVGIALTRHWWVPEKNFPQGHPPGLCASTTLTQAVVEPWQPPCEGPSAFKKKALLMVRRFSPCVCSYFYFWLPEFAHLSITQ